MSNYAPLDGDDTIIPAGAATSQPPAVALGAAPATPTAPTLMDHDDEVVPIAPTASAVPAASLSQDQATDHYRAMFADPNVSGDDLRAYYKQISGKDVDGRDAQIINDRDTYRAAHPGKAGNVQVAALPFDVSLDNSAVDNRPTSFTLGMVEGGHHVIANVAGGAGYLANKVGLTNDWGNELQNYYDSADHASNYQGSDGGKLLGSIMTAAPAALIAAPVEAGAAALGAGDTLAIGAGLLADGGAQGALTTNSKTPSGVLEDTAIGGGLGLGFGSAARALKTLASTPTVAAQAGRDVLDTAARLGVQPLPADVGGPITRALNAGGEAGIMSNVPITNATDRYVDSLQAVRDRAAQSLNPGQTVIPLHEAAGNVLNGVGGLGDYEARSAEQGGKLYDNAADLARGVQIQTPRTLATVNALIDQANRTPGNSPGLAALTALRDDLTPTADQVVKPSIWDQAFGGAAGPQTIPGNRAEFAIDNLRRLRTSFGDNFDANQRAALETANQLWGPLSQDIQDGLTAAGRPDAANAYKAADQNWAQRQTNLDTIVKPTLGNGPTGRSQEELAKHFAGLANTNADGLNQALSLMSPDQANSLRASLVANLGRSKSGVQNATGDAFSVGGFGTHWDKLSPSLKSTMLNGQAGNDLQDLARLSEAAKSAGRYRNTSGTARSSGVLGKLARAGEIATDVAGAVATSGSLATHALGGLATGGLTLGGEYGVGRALASPAVAQGIVRMGEVRPIATSSSALSALARRVAPTIANGQPDQP